MLTSNTVCLSTPSVKKIRVQFVICACLQICKMSTAVCCLSSCLKAFFLGTDWFSRSNLWPSSLLSHIPAAVEQVSVCVKKKEDGSLCVKYQDTLFVCLHTFLIKLILMCILPSLTWPPFWWRSWWRRHWKPSQSAAAWTSPSCRETQHARQQKPAARSVTSVCLSVTCCYIRTVPPHFLLHKSNQSTHEPLHVFIIPPFLNHRHQTRNEVGWVHASCCICFHCFFA